MGIKFRKIKIIKNLENLSTGKFIGKKEIVNSSVDSKVSTLKKGKDLFCGRYFKISSYQEWMGGRILVSLGSKKIRPSAPEYNLIRGEYNSLAFYA